jgi:tRNA-specific 2-thiouridylase
LHMLGQEQLARTQFPVGRITKADVRAHAARLGLRTATKPDSQDVCFITAARGRESFLRDRLELTPGRVVDRTGRQLGSVAAVELVTIGQRKGLGLPGGTRDPRFAVAVDTTAATVTVGTATDLITDGVRLGGFVWASSRHEGPVLVQTSAHGDLRAAVLEGDALRWAEPQRVVAPGQSVVFYEGDEVLGGALVVTPRR